MDFRCNCSGDRPALPFLACFIRQWFRAHSKSLSFYVLGPPLCLSGRGLPHPPRSVPIIPPPDNGCRRIIFTSFLIRIPCPCARCLTDRQAKWQRGRMSCKRTERVRWKSLLPLIDIHHFTFNGIMLWGDIGLGRLFFSLAPCLSQHGIVPAS